MIEIERSERWKFKAFGAKLIVDAASAVMAAGLVAPVVTMIDRYVICCRRSKKEVWNKNLERPY